MTKHELIRQVASETGLKQIEVEKVLNSFVATVTKKLVEDRKVRINGLGIFSVNRRSKRTVRNPRTGEKITVPAKNVVRFKPAKVLSDSIN
ncbi:MAG TPA: HU family DNA-binding protein [Candidatus Aenigmarchaeota archaeon]|nr:HU family DNA-binding protein [Candidatus Aenigmarchaeota archaeon]